MYGLTLGLINAKCPFNWRKHTRIENCPVESPETFYDYDSRQIAICRDHWESKINCKFSAVFKAKNEIFKMLTIFLASANRSIELEESISRGMIHAYDHCTTDISVLSKQDQLNMRLCSSVRAWALSGSCLRSKFGILERLTTHDFK